ncbi:MAG: NAD(+)/NADH kinase [Clostridiales bacterium]|nr:NAD(+)/NADH kinase [Clostridiales bacterium]
MKKIGLLTNFERDKELKYTREILDFLNMRGCPVILGERLGKALGLSTSENIYKEADILIVLGGDGTILKTAGQASKYETPIFGINLGHLGYLAGADRHEGREAIDRVLNGEYTVEKRMMLKTEIGGRAFPPALNDIYIRNKEAAHMLKLGVKINGQYTDTYRGDGVIIASPTGSTAYNLSAGGPVLKPDTSLIAVTQICPHNLYARPLVIGACDKVTVFTENSGDSGAVFIDGEYLADLGYGEEITVGKADCHTYIIKPTGLGFYDILRRKMAWQRD